MKNKASLSAIFATIFIDLMGFGILIPILPTFASKGLGVTDFGIGVLVAVFSLMQFLFNPLLGRLSDKIGRRPIILTSLLFTITSYIIFSFSTSFLILLISRMIAGLGGANIGVAQAYIADITSKEDRSKGMGIIGAAFGLGFVFGPMIGGFLSSYSYAVAGFGAAGLSTLAFLFAFFKLPESKLEKDTKSKIKLNVFEFHFAKRILAHPSIGMLVILFSIIVFSMANIYGTFALLGNKVYNFTDQQNGLMFGIMGIIGAVIQGGALRYLAKKLRDRSLVLAGLISMSVGLALIPYGGNFLGLAVVAAFFSIGTAVLQPTVLGMISKYSPESEQGAILGLNSSFSALARVLGPLWGGFAFDFLGYQFPFITGSVVAFVALITVYFLLTSKRLKEAY